MSQAYYTMTAVDVLLDDADSFSGEIEAEGRFVQTLPAGPETHRGPPDDRRKKHCIAVTFRWFFDAAVSVNSWEAYHCVVRCYAIAAQRRYTCRFSTHVNGNLSNYLLSPAIGTDGRRWQLPQGKQWP